MPKFIYDTKLGCMVDKDTGQPISHSPEKQAAFNKMLETQTPGQITLDIPDYASPVTGEIISGRVARREDLKKHDCFEMDPPTKPLRERMKKRKPVELENVRELNEKLEADFNRMVPNEDL